MGGIDRAADDFNELGDRAAKRDLKVGYEALCWGRHINESRCLGGCKKRTSLKCWVDT